MSAQRKGRNRIDSGCGRTTRSRAVKLGSRFYEGRAILVDGTGSSGGFWTQSGARD